MKPWKILLGVSVGWKIVVLTLGAAVPRWLIGDGLDRVPVGSRAYAEQAKVTAMALWDHPLERLGIVRALRVTRVDGTLADSAARATSPSIAGNPSSQVGTPSTGAAVPCAHQSATVVAYTYFAIPYSQVRTACDSGVVEYRLFRRRS